MTPMFEGNVQGVVVQIRIDSSGRSSNGIFTNIEGSSTILYSSVTSYPARAVSHLGHQWTTLNPLKSSFFSSARFIVHQTDSMYGSLYVRYGLSQSIHMPMSLKTRVWISTFSAAYSLHFSMKFLIPMTSSMSFLLVSLSSFSTMTSTGRP